MSDRAPSRPSIRLSSDEAWAFLAEAHTGIFTTLRADGQPIALPVWFAVVDRRIYVVTRGKKVDRVRSDPRCSFLVEAGERWADLRAVHVTGTARLIDPVPELDDRIAAEMARKYQAHRTRSRAMPAGAREHYRSAEGATIEIVPDERVLSWDNRRLELS